MAGPQRESVGTETPAAEVTQAVENTSLDSTKKPAATSPAASAPSSSAARLAPAPVPASSPWKAPAVEPTHVSVAAPLVSLQQAQRQAKDQQVKEQQQGKDQQQAKRSPAVVPPSGRRTTGKEKWVPYTPIVTATPPSQQQNGRPSSSSSGPGSTRNKKKTGRKPGPRNGAGSSGSGPGSAGRSHRDSSKEGTPFDHSKDHKEARDHKDGSKDTKDASKDASKDSKDSSKESKDSTKDGKDASKEGSKEAKDASNDGSKEPSSKESSRGSRDRDFTPGVGLSRGSSPSTGRPSRSNRNHQNHQTHQNHRSFYAPAIPGIAAVPMIPVPGVPGVPGIPGQLPGGAPQIPGPIPGLPTPGMPDPGFSMLVQQVAYYFSIENLCKDIFLRRQMNSEGLVPVSVVAGFNRVRALSGGDQALVAEALRWAPNTEVVGSKVRAADQWQQWLIPFGERLPAGQDDTPVEDDAPKFHVETARPFVPRR